MLNQRFAKPVPSFFMGKTAANRRITNYMQSKHPLLSEHASTTETKSIWYSLDHFETLYKELVFLNADGIRIYFGNYESDHPDFPGQLCLIMVPTRFNELTEGHKDIVLEDEAEFAQRPGSQSFLSEEQNKPYNYGSPCPTICSAQGDTKYPSV